VITLDFENLEGGAQLTERLLCGAAFALSLALEDSY